MKQLLMASLVLLIFSISLLIVQSSCSKSGAQNTPTNITQLGKIVYAKNYLTPNVEIWTANYDGSNATQVPLTLPSNIKIDVNASYFSLKISPDGQTIFFSAYDETLTNYSPTIYSCSISGTNLTEVIPAVNGSARLGQPY